MYIRHNRNMWKVLKLYIIKNTREGSFNGNLKVESVKWRNIAKPVWQKNAACSNVIGINLTANNCRCNAIFNVVIG